MRKEYGVCPDCAGDYLPVHLHPLCEHRDAPEKNQIRFQGTIFAALLNIGLNAIFIPLFGYIAAAYTTFCQLYRPAVHPFFITRRILKGQAVSRIPSCSSPWGVTTVVSVCSCSVILCRCSVTCSLVSVLFSFFVFRKPFVPVFQKNQIQGGKPWNSIPKIKRFVYYRGREIYHPIPQPAVPQRAGKLEFPQVYPRVTYDVAGNGGDTCPDLSACGKPSSWIPKRGEDPKPSPTSHPGGGGTDQFHRKTESAGRLVSCRTPIPTAKAGWRQWAISSGCYSKPNAHCGVFG